MNIKQIVTGLFLLLLSSLLQANQSLVKKLKVIETDDTDIEVRIFPANGNVLLLGFAFDEGKSQSEEKTAASLAEDGIEVWMPDMLSALMLPKLRSSLAQIHSEILVSIIVEASKTGKDIYLIASGAETELILRAASAWKAENNKDLAGAVLLFPRLFKGSPVPGTVPEYVSAVGTTSLPIIMLEGGRTPNRWGLTTLTEALKKGGSRVTAKVIPKVRGYFFKRKDANRSEDVVTSQLAGLIKVSLFYLDGKNIHD